MKGLTRFTCLILMFALTCTLTGCGDNGDGGDGGDTGGADTGTESVTVTVDETKPIADLQAMAAKMSESDLKAAANKYYEALLAKMAEVDKLMSNPSALLGGGDSAEPGTDLAALNNSVNALKERLAVFVNKLKEMGVDVSDYST